MTEFNTGFPSIRQIQSLIKNKNQVEILLTTGTTIKGVIQWLDHNCLSLLTNDKKKMLIWFHGIVYINHNS